MGENSSSAPINGHLSDLCVVSIAELKFIPLFVWKEKKISAEPIISIYLFVTQIYRQTEVKRFISNGMMGVEVSKSF